jgi:hypothetical protein
MRFTELAQMILTFFISMLTYGLINQFERIEFLEERSGLGFGRRPYHQSNHFNSINDIIRSYKRKSFTDNSVEQQNDFYNYLFFKPKSDWF